MDVRAGAIRAIAASGVLNDRARLNEVVADVTAYATRTFTVTLLSEADIPTHIKSRMAITTATLKATVAHRTESLAAPGAVPSVAEITEVARAMNPNRALDEGQLEGASAIAGSDRVVTISGAAGTGKTTMLRVAGAALRRSGRAMIIVAPTKKASAVAGRETGSESSSLHQLLHDYGWRWVIDRAGATKWTCLTVGELDPSTGRPYVGPRIGVRPGDRIVVDEAGMLDLEAANALLDVAGRTGACVALVGDQHQALPVGHSGAMALFWRRATRQVELMAIHRFKDPAWAELSLRLRHPDDLDEAAQTAEELIATGHVLLSNSETEAHNVLVDAWFDAAQANQSVSLVVATHAEAQSVSEDIQTRRIAAGSVDTSGGVSGQVGQQIFVGDVVQTRRNDVTANVQNRQNWVVKSVVAQHVLLASANDSTDLRRISREYAGLHLHLAYATTVYGVQGETTDVSVVGPGVDAAGLYVGMTRGKTDNRAVVIAPTELSARTQLVETMQRQPVEETIEKSRAAAQTEFRRAAHSQNVPVRNAAPTSSSGPVLK
jgi:ATP-dependent exoDNAse (exonuclease V) alpha subunit